MTRWLPYTNVPRIRSLLSTSRCDQLVIDCCVIQKRYVPKLLAGMGPPKCTRHSRAGALSSRARGKRDEAGMGAASVASMTNARIVSAAWPGIVAANTPLPVSANATLVKLVEGSIRYLTMTDETPSGSETRALTTMDW